MALEATQEHCKFCFDALVRKLDQELPPEPTFSNKDEKAPLFVTWKKRNHAGEEDLRGCIGNFSDLQLGPGLHEYALTSALKDSRFPPIERQELPHLSVGVSLLIDFEQVDHPFDWQVGQHGIRISFRDASRTYGATFLPEVAEEQQWNHQETLKALVRKSGYRGSLQSVLHLLEVVRYRSSKAILSWDQYLELASM